MIPVISALIVIIVAISWSFKIYRLSFIGTEHFGNKLINCPHGKRKDCRRHLIVWPSFFTTFNSQSVKHSFEFLYPTKSNLPVFVQTVGEPKT